jgi:putative Holliday junction resolvase
MRTGRRLAIDVGKVRIGLAVSDLHGILASGLSTVTRSKDTETTIQAIMREIEDFEIIEAYVGLPVSMRGTETASTSDALLIASELAKTLNCSVRLIDERLSTVAASRALISSGRNTKNSRSIVDQVAATVILEQALSIEKSQSRAPGQLLEDYDAE